MTRVTAQVPEQLKMLALYFLGPSLRVLFHGAEMGVLSFAMVRVTSKTPKVGDL